MTARTLRFWRERQTLNKVVFAEEHPRGVPAVVGSLYVSKELLEVWGNPESLMVTVAPASDVD